MFCNFGCVFCLKFVMNFKTAVALWQETQSGTPDIETLSSITNQQHVNIVLPTTVNLNAEKKAFGCLSMILFIYPIVCLLLTDCWCYLWDVYECWTIIQRLFQINWVSQYGGVMSARTWMYVWWLCVCVCLVVAHDGADPAVVAAHTGVDAGVSVHGAVITPGHHSLQLTITHQRTTRVSLQTQTEDKQQWSESVHGSFYHQSVKNSRW